MSEEKISQKLRLKDIDERRNYLMGEINQNELMSKKHKKVYRVLNYIEHLFNLISIVSGCVSISAFASLVDILIGITCSAIVLKICVATSRIKSISEWLRKEKKHDKIISLAKSTLNSVEVLISKVVINSNISHNEFVLINNVPKEFDDIKKETKKYND